MNSKKTTGDTVTAKDKAYTLGERIGGGTEGNVYKIKEINNYLVKVLKRSKNPDKDKRKRLILKRLISRDVDQSKTKLVLPQVVLDPPDLGYIMQYYDDSRPLSDFLVQDPKLDTFKTYIIGDLGFKKRLRTAAIVFDSLHHIHQSGLTFCDISPNNILVGKKKWGIAFIDTDNVVVGNYEVPDIIGTPRYIAPEIINKTASATQESDVFSMASIVFELLTFYHPFVGDGLMNASPDEEELAYKGLKDYVLLKDTSNKMEKTLLADTYLSKKLRDLFYQTFVTGLNDKYRRPLAKEFSDELYAIYNSLIHCQSCNMDYPSTNGLECPECGHKNQVYLVQYWLKSLEQNIEKSNKVIASRVVDIVTEDIQDNSNLINLYFKDYKVSDDKKPFAKVKIDPELNQCTFSFSRVKLRKVDIVDRESKKIDIFEKSFTYPVNKKDIIIEREKIKLEYFDREFVHYLRVVKYE